MSESNSDIAAAPAHRLMGRLMRARFRVLLATMFGVLAIVPFFTRALWVDLLRSTVLVSSIPAVAANRPLRRAGFVLAPISLLVGWLSFWFPSPEVLVAANLINLAFLVLTAGAIVSYVFISQKHGVTAETLAASACAYLLLGVMWAHAYCVLETLQPGSFTNVGTLFDSPGAGKVQLSQFGYFSFVTLSTLGYGDIVPVSPQARSLATLEALMGQLYLAILIARLVGQEMSGPASREG